MSVFLTLGPPFAKRSFASFSLVERPEDELLILELYINKSIRSRALVGYLPQTSDLQSALLPVAALSRALSYAIEVDTAAGIAQGWFIKENNVFQLDLKRQTVLINGQEQALPEGAAEAHYEDIYVQARLIEEWFDLDIEMDISILQIHVNSNTTLPYEEEAARLKRAKEFASRQGGPVSNHSNATLLPYKWLSLPSVILQQSIQAQRSPNNNSIQSSYSVQTTGDVAGFGTRFVFSGSADQDEGHRIRTSQLTFQRRDADNNLLGGLHAGSLSLGDVTFPDVPLLVSRKRGRGISVSSDSRLGSSRAFGPEETIIDGDAPIGWDAELYRNGYFVAFQEVGDEGRYAFEDIELVRGFNLFKIVLYGPEGQTRTETQRVVRGAQMLREEEAAYEFALGQPESDFLPFAEDSQTDSTFGASGRFFYGFRKFLTLGGSVFRGKDATSTLPDEQSAATFSAITAFLGFRTQVQLMTASEGRSAQDIETTTRFNGVNLTLGHTEFKGFNVDDRRLEKRSSVNIGRNFGAFSASARAEKRTFLDQEDETFIDTILSTKVFGVELTNSLQRIFSSNEGQESFDGDLAAASNLFGWRLRSNFIYDLDSRVDQRLQSVRLSGLKTLNDKDTLRLNAGYDFTSNRSTAEARYTKRFNTFSVDVNLGGSSDENYFTGLALRTALQADHEGDYSFVNVKDGGLGSVGLRAYIDANGNERYDEGETLLKNIAFRSNRGLVENVTNEKGTVFVNGLSESVTRFMIDESSLPSIYLKPATDFIDVIPRSGTTATIDLAFTQLGEIDGFAFASEKTEEGEDKPVPGLEIRLVSLDTNTELQTTHTEYDGYYIFSGMPLGSYRVQAAPLWEEKESTLPSQNVILTNEESIQMNINLVLPPRLESPVEQMMILSAEGSAEQPSPKAAQHNESQSGIFIQVEALSNRVPAEREADRLKAAHPDVLGQMTFEVREAVVNSKTYYRILGSVPDRKEGKRLCSALIRENIVSGCNVIKM